MAPHVGLEEGSAGGAERRGAQATGSPVEDGGCEAGRICAKADAAEVNTSNHNGKEEKKIDPNDWVSGKPRLLQRTFRRSLSRRFTLTATWTAHHSRGTLQETGSPESHPYGYILFSQQLACSLISAGWILAASSAFFTPDPLSSSSPVVQLCPSPLHYPCLPLLTLLLHLTSPSMSTSSSSALQLSSISPSSSPSKLPWASQDVTVICSLANYIP